MVLSYLGFGMSLSIFMYHGFIKSIPSSWRKPRISMDVPGSALFTTSSIPYLSPPEIHPFVANFAGAYVKQWGLILTSILMTMVPVIVFFLIAQKSIIKGIVQGSIK